jgi:hypothetical protein
MAQTVRKRLRSHAGIVLGAVVLALGSAAPIAAQQAPSLRVEGRVTYVSPTEMLVALESGGVVMLDLARIAQGEIHNIAQNDYVIVVGFLQRPNHRIVATSIQRTSAWLPTTPSWATPRF